MARLSFRLACCLCRKPIGQAADVYALDAEWQRRFPQMIGTIACPSCALRENQWTCRTPDGTYVDGHRSAANKAGDRCYDCWDHVEAFGTQVALVLQYPQSGLLQGAEAYLRSAVGRAGMDSELVAHIQAALDQHDTGPGADRSPHAVITTAAMRGRPAGREECDACELQQLASYDQPYDHVHWEQAVPRDLRTDGCVRQRGYAVGLAGSIRQTWVFFADVEPALVFGRAGRMSSVDIRSYGVYHAVHEVKFDERSNRDVRTLYLQHGSIDRQPDEHGAFQRWLAGTTPDSSHFQSPLATGERGKRADDQRTLNRSTRSQR